MKFYNIANLLLLTTALGCTADSDIALETTGSLEAAGDLEWVGMPNTCATSISVGPSNVPWVTDCTHVSSSNTHHKVWYLMEECIGLACGKGWKLATGIVGNRVDVDFEGFPSVTGKNAVFDAKTSEAAVQGTTSWENGRLVFHPPGPDQPIFDLLGDWEQVSPFYPHFDRTPGGCVTQYMRKVNAGEKETLFVTPDWWEFGSGVSSMYALGCDSSSDKKIFYSDLGSVEKWTQLGVGDNPYNSGDAVAKEMAWFTQTPANGLVQTPWFRDNFGHVFSYDGAQFVARPVPRDGGVVSITDHHIAARNSIYRWNDNSSSWSWHMDRGTPDGTTIQKIAYANGSIKAMPEWQKYISIGASQLWGIDENGKIHYARITPPTPR